jgi:putative ABC transport system permease protein
MYRPPELAKFLLRLLSSREKYDAYFGDIEEIFSERVDYLGLRRAKRWYWWEMLKAVPKFITESFRWRFIMIKNYMKIAWRNIQRHKAYSFINILGLSIGIAAFILIGLYVKYELSFDRYHENADQIYRVVRDKPTSTSSVYTPMAVTPAPLAPLLNEKLPEVVSATRIIKSQDVLISYGQENFLEDEFFWADPETFEIFSIPLIWGDSETALNEPFSILVSEKTAKKYFGHEDPTGKILKVSDRFDFKITGVFWDMPANSHFVMDIIVPYETYFRIMGNDITNWGSNFSYTYILLREDANPEELEAKFPTFLDTYVYKGFDIEDRFKNILRIQPLTKIHLFSHRNQEIGVNNDAIYIILFSSVAFLFLFISCINYMNLATARASQRGREVGIRKVVGARRGQLVKQFLGESVALSLLAMIFSVLIVMIILPAFNRLVERQLRFDPVNNPLLFIGLVGIVLIVGLFSGSYPAMRISGFRPVAVLRGTFAKSSEGLALRNILVLIQFSISIFLIICTFIVRGQLNFVKNKDVGFSREQIMTVEVRDRTIRQSIQAIKAELKRSPDVVAVSISDRLPNDIDYHTTADWPGRSPELVFPIYYNTAGYDFIDLFGIKIVKGRNFSRDFPSDEKGTFLVNEAAVRAAQWESPIGQKLKHWKGNTGEIIGVMKDFHLHSLHRPIDPLYIYLDPSDFSKMSIKIKSSHISATIDHVKNVMKQFSPSYPFEYSFFDEVFERTYNKEQRMGTIFGSFAVLAIFIACLGLFGLASFTAAQRTKEIGIRKVLGASLLDVTTLLEKEFIRWVLISNVIAWPLAYFAMNKWMQNFAFRVDLSIWTFVCSALLALLIALLAVSYQSVKAAVANPVNSLRYE